VHAGSIRAKEGGEGINKNVLAVTRDLSAGNEGPGEEDKGVESMQWRWISLLVVSV